ncbi:TetR/AcrR family transcriptional regulator [Leptospira wolffii]|uniref:TetR/AcrR family transcriptional regulator n=1 Tax=Leptospira wolffii TaxID=409998 RepID=A0ABV5BK67_9LEPT|nr:TetR/AcrR family transcriptional regulator [Leptospira wolffii]TGL49399.1 TetR/AcrR family transcriptional regulator [Leptospira wolffii]
MGVLAREKLRLRILRIAGDLFLKQGYSDTKMEDLVNEIRVSKKNLYALFANKEEILKSLVLYKQDRLARKIRRLIEKEGLDTSEKVCKFFRSLFGATHPNYFQILAELKEMAPDIRKFIEENRERTVNKEIDNILENGKAAGRLRTDLKSDLLIQTLTACSEAAFRSNLDLNSVKKRLEMAAELDNIFLYGIIDQGTG